MVDTSAAAAWDAEYAAGRYRDEPPVAFVDDIVVAARARGLGTAEGLYVGCGSGRNYVPLVDAGLDLVGLDISGTAIAQLGARIPDRRASLVHGDLSALPPGRTWAVLIAIQVLQHGDRAAAHAHVRAAQQRVQPGGLFCLRVNAVGTDVWPVHEVTESASDGGFTVRYLDGPKKGLQVHFYAGVELDELFADGYTPVLARRLHSTPRTPAQRGQWAQWEAIWQRL